MIKNVSIRTKDPVRGFVDVFFDGVQVADKINMLTIFLDAGKIPHMMISADFLSADIDGVEMNVDRTEQQQAEEASE